jgi:hypothetical protein
VELTGCFFVSERRKLQYSDLPAVCRLYLNPEVWIYSCLWTAGEDRYMKRNVMGLFSG